MKEYQSYKDLDVWQLDELAKVETESATMFMAPKQQWTETTKKQLTEEANIYLDEPIAVWKRNETIVLGWEDDGCISFMRSTQRDSLPRYEYENEYRQEDALKLALSMHKAAHML